MFLTQQWNYEQTRADLWRPAPFLLAPTEPKPARTHAHGKTHRTQPRFIRINSCPCQALGLSLDSFESHVSLRRDYGNKCCPVFTNTKRGRFSWLPTWAKILKETKS